MHTYRKLENGKFQVGHFAPYGEFICIVEFPSAENAQMMVNYLNGGSLSFGNDLSERMDDIESDLAILERRLRIHLTTEEQRKCQQDH